MDTLPDLNAWLIEDGANQPDMRRVLEGLLHRLHSAGIPISRLNCGEMTLHPEVRAIAYRWAKGDESVQEAEIGHFMAESEGYKANPFRLIYEGEDLIRRSLAPDAELDFPILEELREAGHTDYLALGLRYGTGQRSPVGFCTDRPGGFADLEVRLLQSLVPALRQAAEIHAGRRLTRTLLRTYLGQDAGRQVLDGHVRRGDAQDIDAVIWYSDLRGFTDLSDRLPRDFLIHVLNDYFTVMGEPVLNMAGEILKFIGDGMLAIFRIGSDDDPAEVCERALTAAELALAGMRRLNRRREREDKAALDFGLALHTGEVTYGNIGAPSRLDFTVIGPAVNLAARLEKLAGERGVNLITSADFAAQCPDGRLQSIGAFPLKGFAEPQAAFTLARSGRDRPRQDAPETTDQTSGV
jgi:adenylate cyclase